MLKAIRYIAAVTLASTIVLALILALTSPPVAANRSPASAIYTGLLADTAVCGYDPQRYAPQFGSAYAVSQGYTAKGDPQAWSIVDGRLYLNYDRSVRKQWEKDAKALIKKAEANWPAVLAK